MPRRAEPEDIPECAACGFENPVGGVRPYKLGTRGEEFILCELCAGTYAGNALAYPDQTDYGVTVLLKTVCYVGNLLRQDVAGLDRGR